ncbi:MULTISPECIES: FAD-binding oxidoreductase [Variovorax]|uniref:D-lactate dehydrogenase (cytochrome) n=1 Tax=Variovorax boronicumulans TaxID=436515 RepID=A0A1E7TVX2_9BURK|nr:FAD-linked oxidase C-terminal domain-containing protein [Variovorax boronicumulans]ATA51831.1 2-hydroxy-acid oxidase [Variovorax boronicumulans]MDP9881689.1 D-lactate dehydrogenase (cytochrome) [Variovorax boronicumulans]MDP9914878.1 D-lactate dehydrogenase (cytochrome) [Variovorax boronicumulans]MDP9926998.1 D-lactate dehydrogenase (cytochrome) [Variovorax boronicumulans]OEZ28004.1 2-hydroxy-acid oxidase [Variovorax boronicumulans]
MNAPTSTSHLMPALHLRDVPAALIDGLKARFGDNCSTAMAVRTQHGRDESSFDAPPPAAVVFAESTQDVADAVKLASEHSVPVIPFGVGSSLEGHLLAVQGGISIDVSRMNQVLSINADDLTVTVQPGVTRKQLNEEIKSTGLFFPIDPGADASIGGMTATRASGTNAVRYGTMRENVLALEVVTASGDIIRTGTRAKKSSAGYDLTRLMVGSEGTLGVVTEVTLRIYPLPEAVSAAICSFPSIEAAVRTTIETIQLGVPIARVELIDVNTVRMVNAYAKLNLREEPMLLMEFHGSPAGVKEQAETVQELASGHGGNAFEWASTPEERTRLWTARHNSYFAAVQSRPGCRVISTDTCVPISRLADCLLDSVAEADASGIPYFLVGHVGDGNFHFGYLLDPNIPEERVKAEELNHALVSRALALEGTCTGEHGVGLHKMDFLVTEAGVGAIDMMRTIKRALDPKNIMNPGKIFSL